MKNVELPKIPEKLNDAANTRTYKLSLYNTNLWINGQQQPLNLQWQNAMFYPNTYLNS